MLAPDPAEPVFTALRLTVRLDMPRLRPFERVDIALFCAILAVSVGGGGA